MGSYVHPTRKFKKPEELYEMFEKYKEARKEESKEWPRIQYVGKNGEKKEDYPVLPISRTGFKVWCFKNGYGAVHHYLDNKDKLYNEFGEVAAQILDEIRDQQITGGMLKHFDSSITARLNGLSEKIETTNKGKIKVSWKNKINE
jgi:hypothetical protein